MASILMLAIAGCAPTTESPDSAGPSSTPVSEGEIDEATQAYLDANASALADQLGIDNPPEVKPIRLIPLNEWGSTQISCLTDAGFDVSETSDGQGIVYPSISDPALKQSLNLAIYTCELSYPTQQKYMTPLSKAGLEKLYEYRVGELTKCLEAEGYSVTADPPSKTVFVDNGGTWSPYDKISISEDDLKQVYKACPQTPDSVYGT